MIMIVKTPGSQMGSPAAAEEVGDALDISFIIQCVLCVGCDNIFFYFKSVY